MSAPDVKHSSWMRPTVIASVMALGACASLMFVSGCESEVNSYCVARCTCQGCSQLERGDCLDDIEDAQRLAENDGCATEFSAYLSCYANEGSCADGAWVFSTCITKGTALRDCSYRAGKFIRTACEEEEAKRAACGLSGGGASPCAGADECTAFCALAASCNDLASPQPDSTYVQCVIACTSSGSSSGGSSGGP